MISWATVTESSVSGRGVGLASMNDGMASRHVLCVSRPECCLLNLVSRQGHVEAPTGSAGEPERLGSIEDPLLPFWRGGAGLQALGNELFDEHLDSGLRHHDGDPILLPVQNARAISRRAAW